MSYSSGSISHRSSSNSMFSQWPIRDSMSSCTSSWSHVSKNYPNQSMSEAEYVLPHNQSLLSDSKGSPPSSSSRTRSGPRQPIPKNSFKTCVSTHKQSRISNKEHKYFCTACKKTFVSKADWKRHEETYQERVEQYQCDLCSSIYFLDKDFVAHHKNSHRCISCADNVQCSKKRHVQEARQQRRTRTGWGCGFCCHFSNDWTERCNHIARHLERGGNTVANWYHSMVIFSLLQRPAIQLEWNRLLKSTCEQQLTLAWNRHSTGRVEGYPETGDAPQLQDLLEYYTPDQDAALIAGLAFDKLVPPPVPAKDSPMTPPNALNNDIWELMSNTVVADTILPTDAEYLGKWRVV